jgi:predicted ester cyclase
MPDEKLEKNKQIVRRMLKAFNDGDTGAVAELISPTVNDKSRKLGLEPELRAAHPHKRVQTEIMREKEAFPDRKFKEESIVAEGDTVILRWSMTGTHMGKLLDKPPTGKKVKTYGTEIVKIVDGKIVEHDDDATHVLDILGQLDMLTPDIMTKRELKDDQKGTDPGLGRPGGGGPKPR